MPTKKAVVFTEKRVEKFAHIPSGEVGYTIYTDNKTPGLGLRVTKNGARRYIFEKRLKSGGKCRVTIGNPASWPLKKAQERARELTVLIDKGSDPRVVAEEQRKEAVARRVEAARQDLVLEGVWAAYIEARKAQWGDRHYADHIALSHRGGEAKKKGGGKGKTKPAPLASLMPLKLSELTATCIKSWLSTEAKKRPTSTAQAFRLLRAFIGWANDDTRDANPYVGIIPANACSAKSVREEVPAARVKKDDCLQTKQLAEWFKAVRACSNPVISAYLQTLLLSGQRREAIASLVWKDVDFKWGQLTLRSSAKSNNKGGAERVIPLTPYVASLLSALPRKNRWVFASNESESGRLVEPTKAHKDALLEAGIPTITLHGLRRTFSTLAEKLNPPPPEGVIKQIQGHKPSGIDEKHYKRRDIDDLRDWNEKIEAWFLAEAGIVFTRPGDKPRLGVVGIDGNVKPAA